MLSLLLLIIVIWHFYIGYSRGIFLQVFYVLMSMVSLMIASQFYQELASQITLWVPYSNPVQGVEVYFFKDISKFQLSHVYYAGVAFVFIYSLSYLVGHLLGVLLHLAPVEHFDSLQNNIISGFLAVLVCLLFMSMCLTILATVPMSFVQEKLWNSLFVRFLINDLPFFSQFLVRTWAVGL